MSIIQQSLNVQIFTVFEIFRYQAHLNPKRNSPKNHPKTALAAEVDDW